MYKRTIIPTSYTVIFAELKLGIPFVVYRETFHVLTIVTLIDKSLHVNQFNQIQLMWKQKYLQQTSPSVKHQKLRKEKEEMLNNSTANRTLLFFSSSCCLNITFDEDNKACWEEEGSFRRSQVAFGVASRRRLNNCCLCHVNVYFSFSHVL